MVEPKNGLVVFNTRKMVAHFKGYTCLSKVDGQSLAYMFVGAYGLLDPMLLT